MAKISMILPRFDKVNVFVKENPTSHGIRQGVSGLYRVGAC